MVLNLQQKLIIHHGNTANSGHYVYDKFTEQLYNDETRSQFKEDSENKSVNNTYIVLYERV